MTTPEETPLEAVERTAARLGGEPEITVGEDGTIRTSYAVSPQALARALIQESIAAGERWRTCANCGDPYPLTETWTDETVCDPDCHRAYAAYVMGEVGR